MIQTFQLMMQVRVDQMESVSSDSEDVPCTTAESREHRCFNKEFINPETTFTG